MNDLVYRIFALVLSLLCHAALLYIVFPQPVLMVPPKQSKIQVPVKFILTIPPPKVETPKAPPSPPLPQKTKLPTKPTERPTIATPPAPKSIPGDREVAVATKQTFPIYPKQALNQGWTGTVVAEFTIDANGTAKNPKIITSSGHSLLDTAFVKTVLEFYTFEPKKVMGKAVPSTLRLSYRFELENTE